MKSSWLFIFLVILSSQAFSQWDKYPRPDEGVINGEWG